MRATTALLLLTVTLLTRLSTAEDIYWEGEDDASNEFLEVDGGDSGLISHFRKLKRVIRNLLPSSTPSSLFSDYEENVTEDDEDIPDEEIDNETEGGSGFPDRVEPELKEKTLRVTFVVMEPYQMKYSNRDSLEFQNFSKTLAEAVNMVFRDLPGTHRASLVRIQSRPTDEFSCKVTLEIVTTGFEDTYRISEILRDYIRKKRTLGNVAVTDEDFSSTDIDPGYNEPLDACAADELRCSDGRCVSPAARCNGVNDCSDGLDEAECSFDNGNEGGTNQTESEADPRPAETDDCILWQCPGTSLHICDYQRCNQVAECPDGLDETDCPIDENENINVNGPESVGQSEDEDSVTDNPYDEKPPQRGDQIVCLDNEFSCDETRCISASNHCDGRRDCDDGTDEANCPESCGVDDFRCHNGKCIEGNRRCDRVVDCPSSEDEQNCVCRSDEFRCVDDGSCIEERKRCDGISHCRDGSDEDELQCACSSDQWQCDQGSCIKRSKRCDGHVDCPTDRSDERNCIANGYFRCRGGKLIPDYQRCNRRYDCDPEDYSDEQNCPCGDGDFKCDNGYCIPANKKCDMTHDCQDGSDERDCTYGTVCMAYEYKCGNGQCLPADCRCNGTKDCRDGSDEHSCPCKRGQFKCHDGTCLNIAKRCNGQRDCQPYGEDEFYCGSRSCPPDSFTCDPGSSVACAKRCDGQQECDAGEDEEGCGCNHECDGRCLEDRQICDRIPDCSDSSDELNCDDCDEPNDFRCRNGECINADQRCNGVPECTDASDELNCNDTITPQPFACNENQFQCRDGLCINNQFFCDHHQDCNDNSDEENCPWFMARPSRSPIETPCHESEFTCYDGHCIPHLRRCDNIYDCSDFSDEQNCYNSACDEGYWQCVSGQCIPVNGYCDGTYDCMDGSDERDCPTTFRPFTTIAPQTPYPPYIPTTQRPYTPQPPVFTTTSAYDQPAPISLSLLVKPEQQTVRNGGDVVFVCRDEGPLRAAVRWVREGGRPLKPGSVDRKGRLEMTAVSPSDSGTYICQATGYLGIPGSEVRAYLTVERSDPITSRPSYLSCQSHEATCGNGQCIPKSSVCNGRVDCSDGTDEESCNMNGFCEPNEFQCANRKCVLKTWVCDSEDDCGDGSDEQNCPTEPNQQCLSVEFKCASNQCIPKSYHCDGHSDCLGDISDETGCAPVHVTRPPAPSNVRLNPGDTLTLECEAVGVPTPLISWRLNWGHVPPQCTATSSGGRGILTCPDMQTEHSGAYSCEAINNKGTVFATPDSIVYVNRTGGVCPAGYFNSEARTPNECIRCFCFGKSTRCQSADLFIFNMPTPLGEGGTRLVGIQQGPYGDVQIDKQLDITNQYDYQSLRNGATVTLIDEERRRSWSRGSSAHPYLTLPETYNGNQLTSYGGHIKYRLSPHNPQRYGSIDNVPEIIIMGKYQNLVYISREDRSREPYVNARLTPGNWQKPTPRGLVPATREDIMMGLDAIEMILLRADLNNAGVNITDFTMESANLSNVGLGTASLVEECSCPEGYKGRSCEKCSEGYERQSSNPWSGPCVPKRRECPPLTYGDPASGGACRPCPCPLTNRGNQFASSCSLGPAGDVVCDCQPGYEGPDCSYCAPNYIGNPLVPGDSCKPRPQDNCNPIGTSQVRLPDECVCKENVQGRYCDQCKNGSFALSNDFREGCALCFCVGESQQCMVSNLRRKTTTIRFNVPQIVDQVKIYKSAPVGPVGSTRYNAPMITDLQPELYRGEITLNSFDRYQPAIYYWSLPISFAGDKITSYGGFLNYELLHVPGGPNYKNGAADVQLISKNSLTFHYFGDFTPTSDGYLNASVQFLERGWQRPDGKEVSRVSLLLALADVETILIKASYSTSSELASIVSASIETADPYGDGPLAQHVEQCVCPPGYIGTSCEDCAPGFTRTSSGLYLKHCGPCECNGHSTNCHPDTGVCYDCADNTAGDNCELCKDGFEQDQYNNCVPSQTIPPPACRCDPRGEAEPCDVYGRCSCKQNVEGEECDRCRPGTFGLDRAEPLGCLPCYCSGVTRDCHEASHYTRIPLPAPIFGENYGGYTLMDINADQVINDQFVPAPNESELSYVFSSPPIGELYWSIPVFPGNRVLSYGGTLSLTQKFQTGGYPESSSPGTDVILVGDGISIYWTNPTPIRSDEALSYQVPLREAGWYVLNTPTPAGRQDFMSVLRNLRRVLVRATLSQNLVSTAIADVSMDTAAETYESSSPVAKGVEVCMCPEGFTGTSCESCAVGYYRDQTGYCRRCNCNGHDCQLNSYGQVECNCRPPYTGPDCSTVGGSSETETSPRPPPPQSAVVVRITSPTIKIQGVGSTVNFTCQAQSRMRPSRLSVTWSKADGYLPQDRTYIDQRTGRLTITNLQVSDSGKYICQTIDGISTGQAIATLKVPSNNMTLPTVSISPSIKEYYEGDRIELICETTGNPAPRIAWQRSSNRPLPRSAIPTGAYLIIERAYVDDSGEYTCIASNAAGSTDRTAIITVRPRGPVPKEELKVSQSSPTIKEGQSTRVVCTGTAKIPAGTIDWIRQDGTEFLPNVRSDNGILYIDYARLENQGVYMCQTSSYDIEPILVVLTIVPTSTLPPAAVTNITVSVDILRIPTGGSGTVDCYPNGYPLPLIKWTKYQDKFGPNTSQRDNTLIVSNAQASDQGYYLCEGLVEDRPVVSSYVYVEIEKRESPRVEVSPQGENYVMLGNPYDIICTVTAGIPAPVVTWDRNGGRPFSSHVQILQNNGLLRFQTIEVNDEGEYTCTATNEAGTHSASATLKVRSPPEITITPRNYMEVERGRRVEIECRADGYPEPQVSIKSSSDYRVLVPPTPRMAVLSIPQVSDRDDGDYVCTATSAAGTIEETFAIRVGRGDVEDTYPDEAAPSNMRAIQGQETRISCNASDEFRVIWNRAQRQPLQSTARQVGNELIIFNTSKSDSGAYECTLINRYNQEVQLLNSISLLVIAPPRITLRPPTQTVHPGQSPTVECVVEGDDIRNISWRPVNTVPSSRVETRDSTLIFRQIEVEDAGQYECFAMNSVANATAIAEVIVSEETDRPTSESHDNEQFAHVGAAVHLSCNVTQRGVRTRWTKDGRPLPRSVSQKNDGSLFIRLAQKSDTGRYVCLITDPYGRHTSNYINLHIEGIDCSETQFRCYDDSGCIDEDLICDGYTDCLDSSDENNCISREKRRSRMIMDRYKNQYGHRDESPALVKIEQPRRPFRVGDKVQVLCKTMSRDVTVTWERFRSRQFVESNIYGNGAVLLISGVQQSDADVYRCTGRDRYGRTSYDDFNLEVIPGSNEAEYPVNSDRDVTFTARLGDIVDLPCNHNLDEPASIEWRREYSQLPPDVRQNERNLHLERVTEADAGTYVCRVTNNQARVETRATLRVIGVVPKFNGNGWLTLPSLKDAYTQFDIEVSFKPSDGNGIILYNSQNSDGSGDYLVLQLIDSVPEFTLKFDTAAPLVVTGDRPLQLNAWHTIRLSRSGSKVTMDVDNTGPFVAESSNQYAVLDLNANLYVGGAPEERPVELENSPGFFGCVSMLILGREEMNFMADNLIRFNVIECDSCTPNLCLNNGICQEARNERGYMCLCAAGFAGLNCDRTGEACRPGLCGPGKCSDTTDGYKCACPITHTGNNCEVKQNIDYPAFTGSTYLAIKPPATSRFLRMSMKIKPKPPVTDGIIMYCAQSPRGYGGFTSLIVRNGRLEFRNDLGDGNPPTILVSNKTLQPNEWTDVHIARSGNVVFLQIDKISYEAKLPSAKDLSLQTSMYVGGVDDPIVLNNNTGVGGGFSGCIRDVTFNGEKLDLINDSIQSANVQECVNYDRGDIPEMESVCTPCRNGGCRYPGAAACTCPAGFTGASCETRVPPRRYDVAANPCTASPCRNGGTCKIERSKMMNYTCDCPLGYAGVNCQMPLVLGQSVGFNGNGYLELPAIYLRYDQLDVEPAVIALAFHTNADGVLFYQKEAQLNVGGDFIMIRVENGFVVLEWELEGSAKNIISVESVPVTDGARHEIIAKLYADNRVELSVDRVLKTGVTNGISSIIKADSNIYIGGIPEYLNRDYNYPGLTGCIQQVEFTNERSVDLGRYAVAGMNTQRCKEPSSY